MRAPPLIGEISPETLADVRERIGQEIKYTLPQKSRASFSVLLTDIQVEAVLIFLHGVNLPIYRCGIEWKTFRQSAGDGVTFQYCPSWGMGTSDNNDLTRLVFIAHDRSFSVSIKPHSKAAVVINIYKMRRWEGAAGAWNSMHPTLDQARRAYLAGEYVPQDNDPADFIDVDPFDTARCQHFHEEGRRAFRPEYAHPSVENPIPTAYPAESFKNLHWRQGLLAARKDYLEANPNG